MCLKQNFYSEIITVFSCGKVTVQFENSIKAPGGLVPVMC